MAGKNQDHQFLGDLVPALSEGNSRTHHLTKKLE